MTAFVRWVVAATMTIALVAGATPSGVAWAQEPASGRPALGGVWQLNRDLSAPAGGGPGGERNAPGGGRGGGRGGPGGGGRGGPGGGKPNEEEMQQMRETMRELLQPAARLTIVQHEDAISFTDDQGHVRKFVANGKDEKHQLQAATLETKSTWKDGALVIEWETGRGPTVIRSYRVEPELQRLVIETSMKGGRRPGGGGGDGERKPMTHIYDAVVVDLPQ